MNYLNVVKSVLRRLRENDNISSVDDSSYSRLIGDFVNDAKYEVENASNWSVLRNTISGVTVANVSNYELNDSGDRLTILDAVNDTSNSYLTYQTQTYFTDKFLNSTPAKGSPRFYTFNSLSADGDTTVDLYPIPDKVYQFHFNIVQRTVELSKDADDLIVPPQPVILLAYAKAVEERGEDNGTASTSAYATAQRMLNDATALDRAKHPEENSWYVV